MSEQELAILQGQLRRVKVVLEDLDKDRADLAWNNDYDDDTVSTLGTLEMVVSMLTSALREEP